MSINYKTSSFLCERYCSTGSRSVGRHEDTKSMSQTYDGWHESHLHDNINNLKENSRIIDKYNQESYNIYIYELLKHDK